MATALRQTTALRQRMLQDLQLAGLSEHTQEAYLRAVRQLADHFHTPPDRLSEQQVRDYFLHLKNDRKFASGSLGIAYSGIKFFYSHTTPRDWPTLQRLRVRKDKRLPDVLSVDEVRRLIDAVRTHHNRAYFWTVYSLGLRLEEGLHLQVGDIDSERMMVHVHRGKGAKDRYVPLPSRTLTGPPPVLGDAPPPRVAVPGKGSGWPADGDSRPTHGPVERSKGHEPGGPGAEDPARRSRSTRCAIATPPTCSKPASTSG